MKSTFKQFLERIAAVLLLVAALFALAAIVAFGSLGKQTPWGWAFVILGLIALAGWFIGRIGSAGKRDKHANQRTMMGVNAVASVLLLLAILVGLNYMSARHHRILDLTKNHINSLAGQTYKVLDQLKDPLELTYVYAPTQTQPQPDSTDQQLLEAYKNASSKISVKFVNVVNDPLQAQQLQLTSFSGQPVLLIAPQNSKDTSKRQQVTAIDEGNITSAMMKITNPTPKVLYFLGGHGEMSPTDPSGKLSQAKAAFEQQNYTLKSLTLIGANTKIPDDASALVDIAPEQDLSPEEEHLLESYINGKGHLVLMFDPPRTGTVTWPNWKKLLQKLGVNLHDGIVLDFQQAYSSPQFVVGQVMDISAHPILRSIGSNNQVVFPGVIPMQTITPAPPSLSVTPLFTSSAQSQSVLPDKRGSAQTEKGPFTLAAAIERTQSGKLAVAPKTQVTEGMRAVVAGNASFITDDIFNRFANGPYFLGAVNWAVGNDALVSIPPKKPVTNTINMTAPARRFVSLFALLVLPILCLLIGGVVWWKRR
jgi:ABC-type uncharacterized transport system involved in gliding motility auxiliary subunit